MKLRLAVATAAIGTITVVSATPAFAAHRYNVETGNGCRSTSATATDNARLDGRDPAVEQSDRSEDGQRRAAERSPAISGDGRTTCPAE